MTEGTWSSLRNEVVSCRFHRSSSRPRRADMLKASTKRDRALTMVNTERVQDLTTPAQSGASQHSAEADWHGFACRGAAVRRRGKAAPTA